MITTLFVLFFSLLLSDSDASESQIYRPRSFTDLLFKQNSVTELNIEEFMYVGEPITIACISSEDQTELDIEEVNCAGGVSEDFIKKLSNGNGMSIFFHGIGNRISENGRFFSFAKEWFIASQKNICVITYAFYEQTTLVNVVFHLHDMVRTKRIEFVAKQARDLVLSVRDYCAKKNRKTMLKRISEVDVSGFSYGAHIASKTCQYLFWKTKEKPGMLLALDPAKIPFFLSYPNPSISKNDAAYVQVIHTSGLYGMNDKVGHVDIYLDYKSDGMGQIKHALALYVHVATATRRLFIIVDEKGKGKMTIGRGQDTPIPNRNECLVGIYGTLDKSTNGKKFHFSLVNRTIPFWHSVCEYRSSDMFFPSENESSSSSSFLDITESCLIGDVVQGCSSPSNEPRKSVSRNDEARESTAPSNEPRKSFSRSNEASPRASSKLKASPGASPLRINEKNQSPSSRITFFPPMGKK